VVNDCSPQTAPFPEPKRRWRQRGRAYAFVALGGAIGALARYGVTAWTIETLGHAALGTLIANVTGAFLLGYFATLTGEKVHLPIGVRRFVAIGIIGSYTTFSVLSYQTLQFIEDANLVAAAANAGGSLILGFIAVTGGVKLARL
jgi:fluoride exporter